MTAPCTLSLGLLLACATVRAEENLATRLFQQEPAWLQAKALPKVTAPTPLKLSFMEEGQARDGADLLQALIVPGLDQAQHGQWLKAACFVAVEAGVLMWAQDLEDQGQALDADFRNFANANWSFDRYVAWRQHPGEFALEEGWLDRNIDPAALAAADNLMDLEALFAEVGNDVFDASAGEGSHILPGTYLDGYAAGENGAWDHFSLSKTQQFYEMIGKYAQFQRGWSGYGSGSDWEFASDLAVAQGAWSVNSFCAQSSAYMAMRTDSNDKLILADRILGILVVNHLASFVDVLMQRNKALAGRLDLRATSLETGHGRQAGLGMGWNF